MVKRTIQMKKRESSARVALTPREREILHWVAEEKRDNEIATILNLSVRTVEQHVRTCLRKLNVETRTAACAASGEAKNGERRPVDYRTSAV